LKVCQVLRKYWSHVYDYIVLATINKRVPPVPFVGVHLENDTHLLQIIGAGSGHTSGTFSLKLCDFFGRVFSDSYEGVFPGMARLYDEGR